MRHPRYATEEIAARGRAIYEQQLRDKVEPEHVGKFIVIDGGGVLIEARP